MGGKYVGFVLVLMLWIWISFISSPVFAFTVELDSELDRDRMWRITGQAEYFEDGSQLQEHLLGDQALLPPDFRFKSFSRSRGIWAVLPVIKCKGQGGEGVGVALAAGAGDIPDSSSCDDNVTSRVTFRFDAMAQLLDSVQVKCNIGGNATVRILGGAGGPVDLKPTTRSDKLFYYSVDLDGTTMQLDATVYGIGDYILVDKITIRYRTTSQSSWESPITMESEVSSLEGPTTTSSSSSEGSTSTPASSIPKVITSSPESTGNGQGGGGGGTIIVVQLALVHLLLMLMMSFGY